MLSNPLELPTRAPRRTSHASYGSSPGSSLPPFSPPAALSYQLSPHLGLSGASPPSRGGLYSATGDKSNPHLAAKKFWKRLCFDPALDPTEYTVGFIESVQQPERRSGVEAWSMRLHDRLMELPYEAFVQRFCGAGPVAGAMGGEGGSSPSGAGFVGSLGGGGGGRDEGGGAVPYHRIAYFKQGATVVWESEYHKRHVSDALQGSEGGAHTPAPADRPRAARAASHRDPSLPPMPPGHSGAGHLGLGAGAAVVGTPPTGRMRPPMASLLSGSLGGRSPQGGSDDGSDDGLDGSSETEGEEDGEELLLEEEEQDVERRREEAAAARARRGGQAGGREEAAAAGGAAEEAEVPQLPEECWMSMLQQLAVRDVCMVGRTCRWLRGLSADPGVWRAAHAGLWGADPEPGWSAAVVRRMCRRSELRAARWLEAAVRPARLGFPSTACLQMDDSKAVSADGSALRLWSHATGRRIATLQGHAGRVCCLAFDEQLLVSGCTSALVKLWDVDELRCRRTLRGHASAVSAVCLLPGGLPASGAEDGGIKLWDAASGAPIVGLEAPAGHGVTDMTAHGPSGHLVSAGWGVHIWDVSAATLLHTLLPDDDHAPGPAPGVGGQPYTCVSYCGQLLAAGRPGEVALADPRVGDRAVARIAAGGAAAAAESRGAESRSVDSAGGDGGGAAGNGNGVGLGAIAAAAGAGSSAGGAGGRGGGAGGGGPRGPPRCVGVQLDEWKLVTGFDDGRRALCVYDIRALPRAGPGAGSARCGPRGPWHRPLMTLAAPARVNCFQFHEQVLLAGLEGSECVAWRFDSPNAPPPADPAPAQASGRAAAAAAGANGGGNGAGGSGGAGAGQEKKKPGRVTKQKSRYPKRSTK